MGDSYPEVLKIWSAWWKKLLNRERQLLKSSISESSAWLSLCHRLIGITRDVSTSPASSMNKDLCLVIWTKQIKEHSVCYRWKKITKCSQNKTALKLHVTYNWDNKSSSKDTNINAHLVTKECNFYVTIYHKRRYILMEYSVLMLLIPISYTCTYYSVQFYFLPFTMICF